MRDQIIIRFIPDSEQVEWLLCNGDGTPTGDVESGALEYASQACATRLVTALVPSEQVLLTQVAIPSKRRAQILKALPFALEEQLAEDPESLHFAPQIPGDNDGIPTAIVAKQSMDHWIERLETVSIHADRVIPDVLAIPAENNGWSIVEDGDRSLIRTGEHSGFVIETHQVDNLIQIGLATDAPPRKIEINADENSTLRTILGALPIELSGRPSGDATLLTMSRSLKQSQPVNLRQGEYGASEQLGKLLRPWKPVAALIAVWVLLEGAIAGTEYVQYKAENQRLQAEITSTYQTVFPGSTVRDRNIQRKKISRERESLGRAGNSGMGGYLEILAQIGSHLSASTNVSIGSIHFRNEQLTIELNADSIQHIDQLKQKLATLPSLAVDLQNANASKKGASGRIAIRLRTGQS